MRRAFANSMLCCWMLTASLWLAGSPVAGEQAEHPLFRAVRMRDADRVGQLLREGTPLSIRTAEGTTPLMLASAHADAAMVNLLLQSGADAAAANERGETALLFAVSDLRKARLLASAGADVNARTRRGNTPLIAAAALPGGSAVVKLLLKRGAKVAPRNDRGDSALGNAIRRADLETVRALLQHAETTGAVDELIGGDSVRFLRSLASRGNPELAGLLLPRLVAAAGGLPQDEQLLNRALVAQNFDMALVLIEQGANLQERRQPGSAPTVVLSAFSETGDTRVAQALLDRGADFAVANAHGESALTWALRRGHPELIALLRQAGAPDQPDAAPLIPRRQVDWRPEKQQELLRDAAVRSLALLQRSSDVFLEENRSCASCHHQNLPAVAFGWARDRGLPVDALSLQRLVRRQVEQWHVQETLQRCYQLERPTPVPPSLISNHLWSLSALGHPPDEYTEAMVWYLSATQHPDGRWQADVDTLRPPMEGGDVVSTALVLQAIQLYAPARGEKETRRRVRRAAKWLAGVSPATQQDQSFQLLGLGWSGESTAVLADLAADVAQAQREDGGWAQLPQLPSDAWATGQALVALRIGGGMAATDPTFQRGLQFLLSTQFDDGSWFVPSRTFPFQPHFESGFPHGRDQWISAGATAWAALALLLAIEPVEVRLPPRLPAAAAIDQPEEGEPPQVFDGPVPERPVRFVEDVQRVLERSCVACHSGEQPQGGLLLTNRAALLRGGDSGRAAVSPGRARESRLLQAAAATGDDLQMPPPGEREKFPPLGDEELRMLRKWIDAGASWPAGIELQPAARTISPPPPRKRP